MKFRWNCGSAREVSSPEILEQCASRFRHKKRLNPKKSLFGPCFFPGFPIYSLLPQTMISSLYAFDLSRIRQKKKKTCKSLQKLTFGPPWTFSWTNPSGLSKSHILQFHRFIDPFRKKIDSSEKKSIFQVARKLIYKCLARQNPSWIIIFINLMSRDNSVENVIGLLITMQGAQRLVRNQTLKNQMTNYL